MLDTFSTFKNVQNFKLYKTKVRLFPYNYFFRQGKKHRLDPVPEVIRIQILGLIRIRITRILIWNTGWICSNVTGGPCPCSLVKYVCLRPAGLSTSHLLSPSLLPSSSLVLRADQHWSNSSYSPPRSCDSIIAVTILENAQLDRY